MADQAHPDWLMQETSLASKEQEVEEPEHPPPVKEQPCTELQAVPSGWLAHDGGAPTQLPLAGVPLLPQPAAREIVVPTNKAIVYIILRSMPALYHGRRGSRAIGTRRAARRGPFSCRVHASR